MERKTSRKAFKRDELIKKIRRTPLWDVLVIGGGATGLGVALDAASRGYKTLLLEQADFSKGTSSRSTKLIHGGVRYLEQGNIRLVYEALQERGLLLKNAAHLSKNQTFVLPFFKWGTGLFYWAGLKFYQLLAGKLGLGPSSYISREEMIKRFPDMKADGLKGGIEYYDGQFDDSRLAINLAQTTVEQEGVVLNYFKVNSLIKENNKITGVTAQDIETKEDYRIFSKVVVNAAGVFSDEVLSMDTSLPTHKVKPSQGTHIVLDRAFFRGKSAMIIPKTQDGRVLFTVPWHKHVLVGTTDTPIETYSLEPRPLEEEIRFILDTLKSYSKRTPRKEDVLSAFSGLRPLVMSSKKDAPTKDISRNHKLIESQSGLLTIIGGKWTTYRKMAQDTVNKAIKIGGLKNTSCITTQLKIHGCMPSTQNSHWDLYGSDAPKIRSLLKENPSWEDLLDERLPYVGAEVIWAVRQEMARTLEDVLARRLRALFLNAHAAVDMAPKVAQLMAVELGKDQTWERTQVLNFKKIASGYLLL